MIDMPHNTMRPGLPPLPARMAHLPISEKGYPVPFFVAKVDGKWDFRITSPTALQECYHKKLCWLCGLPLGRNFVFVAGPMCVVNRASAEPPSHLECAEYAVKACPFLMLPRAERREANLPEAINKETRNMPGTPILRNPGCCVIWCTRDYDIFRAQGGWLFRMGDPVNGVKWYAEGREATREEAMRGVASGLPILEQLASESSPDDVKKLGAMVNEAMKYIPKGEDNAEGQNDSDGER